MTSRPIWRVIFRSDALPLGESGAEGLSESDSLELYAKLVERAKRDGGTVHLLRDGEEIAKCEVLKGTP